MQPISIGKFLLGITCMGLVWLALKPAMDEFLGPTGILTTVITMTPTETVIMELSMWLCASILLIWLVIKLTKRDRD